MARKILVVDDEEAIQAVVKASLEVTTDWNILAASSATEGMTMIQAEQPDAILLDVMMPELDGISLFHMLKAQALTKNIPVIFLTAKTRKEEQLEIEALGGSGIVVKPFEPATLADHIRALLHWPE
ncbi:response regulator [soil metagenome]